jgi:hypothetical protein
MLKRIVLFLFKNIIEEQKAICVINMIKNATEKIRNDVRDKGWRSNEEIVASEYADIVEKHLRMALRVANNKIKG